MLKLPLLIFVIFSPLFTAEPKSSPISFKKCFAFKKKTVSGNKKQIFFLWRFKQQKASHFYFSLQSLCWNYRNFYRHEKKNNWNNLQSDQKAFFFFLENMPRKLFDQIWFWTKGLTSTPCPSLYVLICMTVIYADQLFFAVITTPWCMLSSSLHYKHFTDSVQSNVENGAALGGCPVQEGNIYSMGSETR